MSTPVLYRTCLSGTTDQGQPAMLNLWPVVDGVEVQVDVSAGFIDPSKPSVWSAKTVAALAVFLADPEPAGGSVTVKRGPVPEAQVAVMPDGRVAVAVLDRGYTTMILDAAATRTFRRLLTTLSAGA